MRRAGIVGGIAACTALAFLSGVTDLPSPPAAEAGEAADQGFVDRGDFRDRQREYLRFATEELDEGSPLNVLAHLERADYDTSFAFDAEQIDSSDFGDEFAKIDAFDDPSDFDLMYLMALWYAHADRLTPELRQAIEERMLGFRYWYTDPLPAGVIDDKYFWSENHRIIFHTLEYLAGQALPDETFTVDGATGEEHRRRAKRRIEAWLAEKARWGFSEWHSDVYYQKDIDPLLLLVEFSNDQELTNRAAMLLDVLFYDLALHQDDGNVGVTHGRSYMKDKSRATDQDTFGVVKLAFATTDTPYTSRSDAGATLLAISDRYRLPQAILTVARTGRGVVDREHMNVPLDVDAPYAEEPESPVRGISFTDPEDVTFWWDRGALTAWQVVPLTLETIDRHELFETELFAPYEALADVAPTPEAASELAHSLGCIISFGLTTEVDTITYRTKNVMLSSSQDYRPGCHGAQYHAWQATLDEDAVVFTTHPGNEPRTSTEGWEDGDQYWTGTGSMPRTAQHGAAAIHLYAPQFASPGAGALESFDYLPLTHAYFPTEHFDEVRRSGNWTLGRRDDAYVALWSWRAVDWRTHDPTQVFTNGLTEPFDLVADGGANNVWIAEVGDASKWDSFDAFADAVTGAPVEAIDLGPDAAGLSRGFEVEYGSPTEGVMRFSSTGPLTVAGDRVRLHHQWRFDNEFTHSRFGASVVEITAGSSGLTLDFAEWTRGARSG